MKPKICSKIGGLRVVSREIIPYNLKRRIANWAGRDRVMFGPVEIRKVRESKDDYSVNVILHCCAEDEMGCHDFRFSGIRFTKIKKRAKKP